MKFLILFALIAVVNCSDHWGAPLVHHAVPVVHQALVHTPIYQTALLSKTVKLGETHHSIPVTEHRFTRTDYETPGATYAIPAVRTVQVTRPGYTTYINSAVTRAHVTNHQVAGPTVVTPIIKPVVNHLLAPVHAPVHHAPLVHHAPIHAPLNGWGY